MEIVNENDDDKVILQKARFVQKLHPNRHKDYNKSDIEHLLAILAMKEGDRALEYLDRRLDPYQMYYLWGFPQHYEMSGFEHGIIRVIQDTCAAFVEFSNWRNERELPDDWRERRQELESENELRKCLISHLNDRLMDYCTTKCYDIFEWTRERALRRWKRVMKHVFVRMFVFYWFESSQRKYYEVNGAIRQRDKSEFEFDLKSCLT
jgi:hypothetical protein